MNKSLNKIIKDLISEGKDYSVFKTLLERINLSKEKIGKDEILDFVTSDIRLQLYSTPNSIAKLIAFIANKNNPTNAIDICCGTGNILYYLQNIINDLTGVEISKNVALLASYFIPELHIITADTFQYPFSRKYELVVGNIPIGMRSEFNGKRIPIEEAFVRKAFELCQDNGEVILLVPYKVLFSSQFKQLRKDYIPYLKEIISLPTGIYRNTQVKTALIVLGTSNSATLTILQLSDNKSFTEEYNRIEKTQIPKKNLTDCWNPEFHLKKDNNFYKELEGFKTVYLKELAEIINGRNIPANKLDGEGQFLYLKPRHIQNGKLITDKGLKYLNKKDLKEVDYKFIIQPGDIIISTISNDLIMYVFTSSDPQAFASNNLTIIRSSEQDYIYSYIQTKEGRKIFKAQAEDLRKGVTIPHITKKDLEQIRIPVVPISELNKLGNNSIEKSSTNELYDYLDLLKSFKKESKLLVKEPESTYGGLTVNQFEFIYNFINDRFNKVDSQLEIANKKLDSLLEVVKEFRIGFDEIRSLPRTEDEKIFKLYQFIDIKLNVIYLNEKITIDCYIEEVKRWLDRWDLLDTYSQKFLPLAEFLFDQLSKLNEADYGSFVIEYCRSLENEILRKLFEEYINEGLKNVDKAELIKDDLETGKKNKLFADKINKNNTNFELGTMATIMSFLKENGNTLRNSKLLQHFRNFTISYFEVKIIEAGFINDLKTIAEKYRNKAAHPYLIDVEMAKECKELLRKSLNVFLESIKNPQKIQN